MYCGSMPSERILHLTTWDASTSRPKSRRSRRPSRESSGHGGMRSGLCSGLRSPWRVHTMDWRAQAALPLSPSPSTEANRARLPYSTGPVQRAGDLQFVHTRQTDRWTNRQQDTWAQPAGQQAWHSSTRCRQVLVRPLDRQAGGQGGLVGAQTTERTDWRKTGVVSARETRTCLLTDRFWRCASLCDERLDWLLSARPFSQLATTLRVLQSPTRTHASPCPASANLSRLPLCCRCEHSADTCTQRMPPRAAA